MLPDNENGKYVASRNYLTYIWLEESQRVFQVIIYAYELNIKTNLLQDYVNVIDATKKNHILQNTYGFICSNFILVFIFSSFKDLNE